MKNEVMKKRSECIVIIINLAFSLIAISFLIGLQTPVVSGIDKANILPNPPKLNRPGTFKPFSPSLNPVGTFKPFPPLTDGGTTEAGKWAGDTLFKKFTTTPGTLGQGLAQGVAWAGIALFVIPLVGGLLGLEEGTTNALKNSVASGLFTYRTALGIEKLAGSAGWIGLGVGAVVF